MLLTSWVRSFAQSIQAKRRTVRRGRYRNHLAWHGSSTRSRRTEALEARQLLTALVVDQQFVDARNGVVNIRNVDLDIDSDGTPEFDSIVVDSVQISGAGTGINITLSGLDLDRIAFKQVNINGTGVEGIDISLTNVDLDSLTVESSNITSDVDPGVDVDLVDVLLPELTVYQSIITGGFGSGLRVDLSSDTRNSLISELDVSESTIDGVELAATGRQLQVFDVIPGATALDPVQIVAVDHGLQDGTEVTITGVSGISAANTRDTLTVVDENTFKLDNTKGGSGVYLSGGSIDVTASIGSVRITKNSITGSNGDDGLSISLNHASATALAIENNTTIRSVELTLTDAAQDGITIRNNTIDATVPQVDGIYFDITRSSLTNLRIEGNKVQGNGVSGSDGIVVNSVDSNVYGAISGNTVDNTLGDGLRFDGTSTAAFVTSNRGPVEFDFSGFSAETTLVAALDASATLLQVVDGRAFRAQQYVQVDDEVMFVTAVTGNSISVVRAQRSTLALAHANGSRLASVTSALSGTARGIFGNTFSNNDGAGFKVDFNAGASLQADVTNNSFVANQTRGIDVTVDNTRAAETSIARGGISRTDTTLNVNNAAVFGAFLTPFNLQLEGETVTVTAVNGNALTVVRGVNGTQAAFHATNTAVTATSGDGLNLNIGGTTAASGNRFTGNRDDAISVNLLNTAAGSLDIRNNIITASEESIPDSSNANAVSVTLAGTAGQLQATATVRRSVIDSNLIGTSAVTSLSTSVTAAATVFTVADTSIFAINSLLRIDGEEMRVTNIVAATRTLTVQRGQSGTTATTHVAGALLIPVTGGNQGRGIDLVSQERTTIEDLQITNNVIANNNDDGVRIRREGEGNSQSINPTTTQNNSITIASNTINRNALQPGREILDPLLGLQTFGAGIEVIAQHGSLDSLDVEITKNKIIGNRRTNGGLGGAGGIIEPQSAGISLRAEADAVLLADIIDNVVTHNEGNGIYYTTREESATDERDIGGMVLKNTIAFNGQDGIELGGHFGVVNLLEIGRAGVDAADGRSLGNVISSNNEHGININHGGNVSIVNNQISSNGVLPQNPVAYGVATGGTSVQIPGSGVFLSNTDPSLQVDVNIVIDKNTIQSNRAMGIDLNATGFTVRSNVFATIRENLISLNQNDGIELSGPLNVTAFKNTVDRNVGRGLDIMNFNSSTSNYRIGDGLESGRNTFIANGQEGIYYISSAGVQDQNLRSSDANSAAATGGFGTIPQAILQIDTNTIKDNGTNSAFSGSGLVMRIGSADSVQSSPFSNNIGTSTGIGAPNGLNVAGLGVNGRTNARVVGNDFEGNFGADVTIVPFISTTVPPTTAGTWGRSETPIFNVASYTNDPLSRLNLQMQSNRGNGLDVMSNGLVAYNNPEGVFKSRDGATQGGDSGGDAGPFGNISRARSVTQIPSRMTQGLPGDGFFPGNMLNPGPPNLVNPPLGGLPNPVYNNDLDIVDITGGDGLNDLVVTTATPYTFANLSEVQVAGAFGIGSNGAQHMHAANGKWRIQVIDALSFRLIGTASNGGLAYAGGGRVSQPGGGTFLYPGIGPSTFRIASNFDTSGAGTQNSFTSGDNFYNYQTNAWETWTPLKSLSGVVTDIQSLGGGVIQVTSPSHGLTNRRVVRFDGITGSEDVNTDTAGSFVFVQVVDADTFTITGNLDDGYINGGEWRTVDDSFIDPRAPTFPQPIISDVTPDPRTTNSGVVTIKFSEPVTNVDIDDFILKRDGVPVDISGLIVNQVDSRTVTIDLSSVTTQEGLYELTQDNTAPEARMVDLPATSLTGPAGVITINFTENVTGVDINDFVLQRNINDGNGYVPINLSHLQGVDGRFGANILVNQISSKQYTVDLTALTNEIGDYRFSLLAPRSDVTVTTVTPNVAGQPIVIRSQNPHNLSTGMTVEIDQINGTPSTLGSINGQEFVITVLNEYEFRLIGTSSDGTTTAGGRWNYTSNIIDETGRPFAITSFGIIADTRLSWTRQNTVPTADIKDVSLDPRAEAVTSVEINFSEPVRIANVNVSDFRLTRDVGFGQVPVSLTGASVTAIDPDPTGTFATRFTLNNLGVVTGPDGQYRLTLITTDSSRITDAQGSFLAAPAIDDWVMVTTGPFPMIQPISPQLRTIPVDTVTFTFNQNVNGVDLTDANTHFLLTRNTGSGPVVVPLFNSTTGMPIPITRNSGSTYELDLSSVTGDVNGDSVDGTYSLTLRRGTGIVLASNGRPQAVDSVVTWTQDATSPTADIENVDPSPRIQDAGYVVIQFSELISGMDRFNAATDFDLTLDIGDGNGPQPVSLAGVQVRPIAPRTGAGIPIANPFDASSDLFSDKFVIDLRALTAIDGIYTLSMKDTGAITDANGNAFVTTPSSTNSWILIPKGSDTQIIDSTLPVRPVVVDPRSPTPNFSLQSSLQAALVANYAVGDDVDRFFLDLTAPQVVPGTVNIDPDPRSTSVGIVTIKFTESVSGVNLSDLVLRRNGSNVSLSGLILNAVSSSEYTIDLNLVTGAPGSYEFFVQAPGSLIQDAAGNALQGGLLSLDTWVVENIGPSAAISVTSPRITAANDITVDFTKNVRIADFGLSDLRLERNTGSGFQVVPITSGIITPVSPTGGFAKKFTVNLSAAGLTDIPGDYRITLVARDSGIVDQAGIELAGDASTIWVLDNTKPIADIIDVLPDPLPSGASAGIVNILFSESVTGVDIGDFVLTADNVPVDITAAPFIAETQRRYVIDLTNFTKADHTYALRLNNNGSIRDLAGNNLATGALATAINSSVTTLTLSDARNFFGTLPFNIQIDAERMTVLAVNGNQLTVTRGVGGTTAAAHIAQAPITIVTDTTRGAVDTWFQGVDITAPTGTFTSVTSPRNTPAGIVTINFTEGVTGVDIADFKLTRDGAPVSLTDPALLTAFPGSDSQYLLDLTSATFGKGDYVLSLVTTDVVTPIRDKAATPNSLVAGTTINWTNELIDPNATIVAVTPDPRLRPVGVVTVNFTQPVQGVDINDFRLTRDGQQVSLRGIEVQASPSGAAQYFIDLTPVTGSTGRYRLSLVASGSGVTQISTGNPLLSDAIEEWDTSTEIAVTTTSDAIDTNPGDGVVTPIAGGKLALRAAVMEAGRLAGDDTIVLDEGVYTLSIGGTGEQFAATGDLDIFDTTGTTTIRGKGAGLTIIDGGLLERIFHVTAGANLVLDGVTIRNGRVTGSEDGGGIRNDGGVVEIRNSVITDNRSADDGGAINNDGQMLIVNTTITRNQATNNGGAIRNVGALRIENSLVGGVYTPTSNPIVDDRNKAGVSGGGIVNLANGTVAIVNSTISGNAVTNPTGNGGGISNQAPFPNISGVLAANITAGATTLLVTNASVFPNQEVFDIRIDNEDIRVTQTANNTFSITRGVNGTTPAAHNVGALVLLRSNLSLVNATIDNNQAANLGGGLHVTNGRTLVKNTIIGGTNSTNVATNGPDVWNNNSAVTIVSLGGNVVARNNGATAAFPVGATVGTVATPVNPGINPLANNGGPTLTHALRLGSVAIDIGQPQLTTLDQRGITRVLTTVDAGAYEFGGFFVDSTIDSVDVNPGDGIAADNFGRKTLRAAIMEANALAGPNAIRLANETYQLGLTELDKIAPTIDIVDVTPDPLQAATTNLDQVDTLTLNFSEPVNATPAQILAQLQLRYTAVGGTATLQSLAGVTITQNPANITQYTLSGLRTLLAPDGLYEFRFVTAPAIADFENNAIADDTSIGIVGAAAIEQFIRGSDKFSPTAALVPVSPDPRTSNPGVVTLNFNEAVTGVDLSAGAPQFTLTYNDGTGAVNVPLTSTAVQQITQSQYILDLTNVQVDALNSIGLDAPGTYTLTFNPVAGTVTDLPSNPYVGGALVDTWTAVLDNIPPVADIVDVPTDPRIGKVGVVTIQFDEDVVGVNLNNAETQFDLTLDVDGPGPQPATTVDLSALTLTQVNDSTYTLDLSTVSTRDGFYTLTLDPSTFPGQPIADTVQMDKLHPNAPNRFVAAVTERFVIGDDVARFTNQGLPIPVSGMSLDDAASFGDIDITAGELTIIGSDPAFSKIDGANIDRVLDVYAGVTLHLVNIGISGGQVVDGRDGGGIRSDNLGLAGATLLDLVGSELSTNKADGRGGAVFSNGTVTVTDSTLSSNNAGFGAGIYNEQGSLTVAQATISGNIAATDGGGIYNDRSSTLSLVGANLSGNTAQRHGGGLYNNDSATATLVDSTLNDNSANVDGGAVFNELAANLTIDNSTVASNDAERGGGVFDQDGNVTITRSALSANTALLDGGALYVTSAGTVLVSDSTFSGNLAGNNGGAIDTDGTVTLDTVLLADNKADSGGTTPTGSGGAIDNSRSLTIQTSILQGNSAATNGGAIRNSGNGSISIALSTISGNEAGADGGSLYNTGSATITVSQSTIADSTAGDQGGGIYQESLGAVGLTNSTISSNRANFGGGVYNSRAFNFSNSTLSSNIALTDGGGLYNDNGTATLQSATVYANRATSGSGGGIRNTTVFGPVNLKNTIVAANLAPTNPDVSGPQFVSQGNNLIGNVGTVTTLTMAGGNVIGTSGSPVDPLLGPLQDNGGPTKTHALLFGSPARDKGSNVGVSATDQRGFARIFDGDGNGTATVDIGAFESGFVVNTFLDTVDVKPGDLSSADNAGNSSLRAAVMEANALDGDDTILLLPGTFKLTIAGRDEDGSTQGDLDVTTDSLTIIGSGTDQTIIDAASLDRIFHVRAGATLNLKNLTVVGGQELLGGGILNQGTITLENVIVTGNQADFGGGLYNDQVSSTLAVAIGSANTMLQIANPGSFPTSVPFDFTIGSERIRVTNVATVGAVTTFTVTRGVNGTTAVAHNLGDKVTMVGSAAIVDSSISNNEARLQGGGIFNRSPLTLTRADVSDNNSNSQGGGLFNRGTVTMMGSTFDGNATAGTGGAIYNDQGVLGETATIGIDSSTLSNNVAGVKAGGIYNNDVITILNSTISGNSAQAMGGGIINTTNLDAAIGSVGMITVTNTTIVLNSTDGVGGGFINQAPAGRANVRNTIVSGNTARIQDADIRGAFTSLGANFIGDAGTSTGFVNLTNEDQVGSTQSPFDAVFGPLSNNGGPTLTHPLLNGSPAVDNGNNSGGEPVDQRGGQRPTDNTADVGSFEVQENHIRIFDVEAPEGDTGETLFVFAVVLMEASAEPVTVSYRTEANSAKTGSDFLEQTGTITFAPGELTKTIVIEVNGDVTSEAGPDAATAEKFFVRLFSPVNAIIDDNLGQGSIINDDVYVTVSDGQVVEGDSGTTTVTFTVSLDVPSVYDVTVDYQTANDSAVAGSDYVATSGSLFFASGETSKTVTVTINGDTSLEAYERFFLDALASSIDENGDKLQFAKPQGIGTILNDEVSFLISDAASATEGNTGTTTPMTFTVTLAQPVGVPVSVNASTVSGTAIGNSDYQSKTQTLTFNPNSTNPALAGDTSKNFVVTVIGDSRFEPNEQFTVTLSNPTRDGVAFPSATLDPTPAVGTINNDDSPPTQWLIQQNAGTIETYRDGMLVSTSPNLTAPVNVVGTANDDVFTIDYTNGNPIPTGGLNIDGGLEIGGDSVVITDSSGKFTATNIVYTATGGESGTISIDGSVITYSELEPIVDNLASANRTINLTDAVNHNLQIVDDTAIAGNSLINSVDSKATFESVSFLNPTSTLTVNLGSGNNTAAVASLDPAFAATFVLNAGAGNDTIDASLFTGAFTLNGDAGDDSLSGGSGNETMNGGAGADTLFGSGGNDTLRGHDLVTADDNLGDTLGGGIGDDNIVGQGGNDSLLGGNGNDTLDGGVGNDTLAGGLNNDNLHGGDGVDVLNGEDGVDTLQGDAGNDTLNGGAGADSLDGGADNDSLLGGNDNDTLNGGAGNDLLSGELGDDSLLGGNDNDTLDGGAGNNSLNGELGTDRIDLNVAGLGTVILTNATLTIGGSPTTFSSIEEFKFIGGDEASVIDASAYTLGAVTILGNGGNDTLLGGGGNDSIDGGLGNDTINAGGGNDSVTGNAGNDTVDGGAGNDTLLGNSGSDSLLGGLGADVIQGAVGLDTILGGDGDDNIDGGDEADSLLGEGGNDLITGAAAIDIIFGGDGNDSLYGGDANDTINGGLGNDFLLGDNNDDSLIGGGGNDSLLGAAGLDFLVTGEGNDLVDGQGTSGDVMQVADGTSGNDTYSLTYSSGFLNLAKTSGTAFSVMFRRTEVIVLNTAGGADVFTTGDLTGSIDSVVIQLSLGDGDDSLNAGANSYSLITFQANGGAGNDSLVAGNSRLDADPSAVGRNVLDGDFGNDFIVGGNGNDMILGGQGNDNMYGGGGNDTVQGGVGDDYIRGNGGNDSILAGDGNDTAKGDAGNDSIDGGAGNDKLAGDAGNDAMYGGDGDDTIKAGDGNDFVDGGAGGDLIRGDAGNDRIVGGLGRDILLGDDGADTLSGTNDPDILIGGLGVDSLLGNGGVDTLVGGTGSGTPPSESNFYLEPGEVDNAFVLSTSVLNMFNF